MGCLTRDIASERHHPPWNTSSYRPVHSNPRQDPFLNRYLVEKPASMLGSSVPTSIARPIRKVSVPRSRFENPLPSKVSEVKLWQLLAAI